MSAEALADAEELRDCALLVREEVRGEEVYQVGHVLRRSRCILASAELRTLMW